MAEHDTAVALQSFVMYDGFTIQSKSSYENVIKMVAKLKELELDNVLIVVEAVDDNLYLAARNLKNVEVVDVQGVNPVNLIRFEKVLFTVEALKKAEEKLA